MAILARSLAACAVIVLVTAGPAAAEQRPSSGASPSVRPQPAGRGPIIRGGHDRKAAWLAAEYRELQVRKRTEKQSRAMTIELQVESDLVSLSVAHASIVVTRNGRTIAIDGPEALLDAQQLLGGSPTLFAARAMLSELELESELQAPDMALLATAAFVSSLGGDVHAPRRLADRWVAKYRGIVRPVRLVANCWSTYSTETTAAWNDMQACMAEADNRGFLRAAYERIACNGIWLLRSESAWFEYLTCISPIGPIAQ